MAVSSRRKPHRHPRRWIPRGRIANPSFAPAGDIVTGGNSFEVLFLAAADIFYREGSIYHAFTRENVFTAVLAILMTGVLLLGMLRRERYGVAGIGFESAIVLLLYTASLALVFV